MKIGVDIEITMKTEATENVIQIQFRMFKGSSESMTSMSFVNLLMILPKGVVSKNDIGSRSIVKRRPLCKFRAALRAPRANTIALINKANPVGLRLISSLNDLTIFDIMKFDILLITYLELNREPHRYQRKNFYKICRLQMLFRQLTTESARLRLMKLNKKFLSSFMTIIYIDQPFKLLTV